MTMKVPFLTDQAIDSATHELLLKFSKHVGVQVNPPIPVDDIIEKYLRVGLEITDLKTKLGTSDVLGAAYFDEKVIRVDQQLEAQEGRLCFTMAHEVGHWQLHRPIYEMDKVAPLLFGTKDPRPAFLCRSGQKPPAEIQADKFAARLLMPSNFVREAFAAVNGSEPVLIAGLRAQPKDLSVIKPWAEISKSVIKQGHFNNVSIEAMRYRLQDLNLVRDRDTATAQRSLL
ncbi:ImmA/IrrE family metallo-endopeptidase [Corallococcus sp. CA054B]|uniref:ImmA/IrrE family metallo-endopeptidase n=1 Tax=Corallococcus sp. CA054B TaxID=2316734 RepID=UPI000EA3F2C9|nr:ImmA/IrrE family metallo-endopeptidase [Corallococcus sp. CA054B]RKG66333.1 ImmA/IrrE family metallo-endopeptidase [Corallococcus sp. CA054B]